MWKKYVFCSTVTPLCAIHHSHLLRFGNAVGKSLLLTEFLVSGDFSDSNCVQLYLDHPKGKLIIIDYYWYSITCFVYYYAKKEFLFFNFVPKLEHWHVSLLYSRGFR